MFDYIATHVSVGDGSDAMQVGEILGDLIVLINEDGFAWSDHANQWKEI